MTSLTVKIGVVVAGVAMLAVAFGQRGDAYRVTHMERAVDAWLDGAYPGRHVGWNRIDDGSDPDRVVIRLEEGHDTAVSIDGANEGITFEYGKLGCGYCRCWHPVEGAGKR